MRPPVTWILTLTEVRDNRTVSRRKVISLERSDRIKSADDVGLRLDEAKQLLASVQRAVAASQFRRDDERRAICGTCGHRQSIKDYRARAIDTLFGRVDVRCPRYRCRRCALTVAPPSLSRATSEFDTIRASLAAHLPYRVAADVLTRLLPVDAGAAHTTIRNRTAHIAERLEQSANQVGEHDGTEPAAAELTLGLDTGFVRSNTPHVARHHAVLVGCAEGQRGERRRFTAIQSDEVEAAGVIRQHLDALGHGADTELTVLTDGAEGLRALARRAVGSSITPVLDWFHIAMRLQHLRQKARGLSTYVKTHHEAKARIRSELERLRWRLWHGRTDSVSRFRRELSAAIRRFGRYDRGHRRRPQGHRELWAMLFELERYVCNHEVIIPNYHRRQRAGLRVSTALVESAVNSVVNQRMNKRRQMRWSEGGTRSLLRVRTAVINGELERLEPAHLPKSTNESVAMALAA